MRCPCPLPTVRCLFPPIPSWRFPPFSFDNSQNGNVIGFPKGETELVDAVNKIIDEVLEQGLYDQWLEEATAEAENLGL